MQLDNGKIQSAEPFHTIVVMLSGIITNFVLRNDPLKTPHGTRECYVAEIKAVKTVGDGADGKAPKAV